VSQTRHFKKSIFLSIRFSITILCRFGSMSGQELLVSKADFRRSLPFHLCLLFFYSSSGEDVKWKHTRWGWNALGLFENVLLHLTQSRSFGQSLFGRDRAIWKKNVNNLNQSVSFLLCFHSSFQRTLNSFVAFKLRGLNQTLRSLTSKNLVCFAAASEKEGWGEERGKNKKTRCKM